ncbi:MAG: 2-oxo acid dehydrogenase subunit E2 [Candidatus Melainabacteria bacterium]|nr:2-oxo acid dehydrogenase subunit E2 [Candidatus Melainabacteria bacterium]
MPIASPSRPAKKRITKHSIVDKPMATSRRTILDLLRIIHSKAVPGYLIGEFDCTYANELRKTLASRGSRVTVTAILLKAVAIAQQEHPRSRTEVLPFGREVTYHDIVAGFTAERVINGQPTVFLGEIDAPITKPLREIALELKDYGDAPIADVRPLKLQEQFSRLPGMLRSIILRLGQAFPTLRLQCQHATFGVSSLGKFGIHSLFTPCLCTATFGIGSAEDRVVVVDGELAIRQCMAVSLIFDQRVLDSGAAGAFVDCVRNLFEGGLDEHLAEEERLARKSDRVEESDRLRVKDESPVKEKEPALSLQPPALELV